MGAFYRSGEEKKRPGVYQRYEKQKEQVAGGSDGVVAMAVTGNWGPLNEVLTLSGAAQAAQAFGSGGKAAAAIQEAFLGGARRVLAVRAGGGGTKGKATLQDAAETPADAVIATARYEGDRAFKYMLRPTLGDSNVKEFVLTENGEIVERIRFAAGENEAEALVKAGAASRYVAFAKAAGYAGSGALSAVTVETAMQPGTDPAVAAADYGAALAALEPYRYKALCVDTEEPAAHALLAAFVARTFEDGKLSFGVVGEPVSVSLETRRSRAAAFNDYRMVHVGGGWLDEGGRVIDGHRAAARVAGLIVSTSASQAITHKVLSGAADVAERLTNAQYDACIESGMIVFSLSPAGEVWVDSGVTTLIEPSGEDDAGWKKIKRAKVRFEIFDRIDEAVAPMIGAVSNTPDGRASVIQAGKGVLLKMADEGKIEAGAEMIEDAENPAAGDSAWFLVGWRDIDSLEKIYVRHSVGGFAPNA